MIIPSKTFKTSDFSPAKGDKYSPRLHRWLRRRGIARDTPLPQAYRDEDGRLWVGRVDESNGWFTGSGVQSILCGHRGAGSAACYPKAAQLWKLKEEKNFWSLYYEFGRCAVDTQHKTYFVGGENRFTQTSRNRRTCNWCGQKQCMKLKREVIKHEIWSNA